MRRHGQRAGVAREGEVAVVALEARARRSARRGRWRRPARRPRRGRRVEIVADQAPGRAGLLDLGDQAVAVARTAFAQRVGEAARAGGGAGGGLDLGERARGLAGGDVVELVGADARRGCSWRGPSRRAVIAGEASSALAWRAAPESRLSAAQRHAFAAGRAARSADHEGGGGVEQDGVAVGARARRRAAPRSARAFSAGVPPRIGGERMGGEAGILGVDGEFADLAVVQLGDMGRRRRSTSRRCRRRRGPARRARSRAGRRVSAIGPDHGAGEGAGQLAA